MSIESDSNTRPAIAQIDPIAALARSSREPTTLDADDLRDPAKQEQIDRIVPCHCAVEPLWDDGIQIAFRRPFAHRRYSRRPGASHGSHGIDIAP